MALIREIREQVFNILEGDTSLITTIGGTGRITIGKRNTTIDYTNGKVHPVLYSPAPSSVAFDLTEMAIQVDFFGEDVSNIEDAMWRVVQLLHGESVTLTLADFQSLRLKDATALSWDDTLSLYSGTINFLIKVTE